MDRILVIRLSSIGDIILASPLVAALRARYPGARIDFAVKARFADLLRFDPHIDDILAFDGGSGMPGLLGLARRVRDAKYDLVVDIHRTYRSTVIKLLAGAGATRTFDKQYLKRALLVWGKWNLHGDRVTTMPERYVDCVRDLIGDMDMPPVTLHIDEQSRASALARLASKGPSENQPLVALAPGAAWHTKRWPPDRFGELGAMLAGQNKAAVAVVGGEGDRDVARHVYGRIGDAAIDLTGTTSLLETAVIIQRAGLLVSNDTGCMHMGRALRTPMVALFGCTVRELGYYPHGQQVAIIEKPVACRPCTHNGRRRCPKGHFKCMRDITVDEVFRAAQDLLRIS
ncbi:MAG: lipopolysaccharide heptosyltransferase II [Chitinivibrionales bacterium]|nr:lipopolysaccharide heptosyltransferase II [Chitinivibrionales bacterium]MBD3397059.1 lipopolysaccharide heptosyltransferase II [Chitinivibrionales bacterium]